MVLLFLPYVKEIAMDSVFNALLWSLQVLTAAILLLQACFDLSSNLAEKRRKRQFPLVSIPDKLPENSLSTVIQENQSQ
jgi:hypothetical protein